MEKQQGFLLGIVAIVAIVAIITLSSGFGSSSKTIPVYTANDLAGQASFAKNAKTVPATCNIISDTENKDSFACTTGGQIIEPLSKDVVICGCCEDKKLFEWNCRECCFAQGTANGSTI